MCFLCVLILCTFYYDVVTAVCQLLINEYVMLCYVTSSQMPFRSTRLKLINNSGHNFRIIRVSNKFAVTNWCLLCGRYYEVTLCLIGSITGQQEHMQPCKHAKVLNILLFAYMNVMQMIIAYAVTPVSRGCTQHAYH